MMITLNTLVLNLEYYCIRLKLVFVNFQIITYYLLDRKYILYYFIEIYIKKNAG